MPSKKWTLIILGLGLVYLVAWYVGCAFSYCGFVQPDTCWLLKMGQIIVEARGVPRSDPFSFTVMLAVASGIASPFVVYQWLSEVVIYLVYLVSGYKGLLAFGAVVSALTFICIPLRICLRANVSLIWAFLIVACLPVCVCQRFQVRPEIFSCFFLSILFCLLQKVRLLQPTKNGGITGGINWKLAMLQALLLAVWCNFHTGFVIGIILLAFYAGGFALEDTTCKRRFSSATKTMFATLVLSGFATLFNPYGLGLWLYLPHLFFSPINALIVELHPLSLVDLLKPRFLPFAVLLILCYGGILVSFLKGKTAVSLVDSPLQLMSILAVQVAAALPFFGARLISFSAIILVMESANCIGNVTAERTGAAKWLDRKVSWLALELAVLSISFCSVMHYAGNEVPICLPEPTHFFNPPIDAMKVFAGIYKGGRIFSAAEIGDMLDLYISPKKAIFLDTRYDVFSRQIVEQHKKILLAEPGWKELLDFCKIDWVFVLNDEKITPLLERDPNWMTVYSDQQATILRRRPLANFVPK